MPVVVHLGYINPPPAAIATLLAGAAALRPGTPPGPVARVREGGAAGHTPAPPQDS